MTGRRGTILLAGRNALVLILVLPIHVYRLVLSPMLGPRCRYHPSCSGYAVEALRSHGPARGSLLAAWRVLRCNPLSDGGVDPVPPRRSAPPRHRSLRMPGL